MNDRDALARDIGAAVPDDWPNTDLRGALPQIIEILTATPAASEWIVLAVERSEGLLIGSGGFIGLPDLDGAIEIGFGLIPAHRGRGYGREIADESVRRAFRDPIVRVVVGRAAPDNLRSLRLLAGLGFLRDGSDEDGNLMWRLDRDHASAYSTAASA